MEIWSGRRVSCDSLGAPKVRPETVNSYARNRLQSTIAFLVKRLRQSDCLRRGSLPNPLEAK